MSYIYSINNVIIKYPYTRGDLTRDNPNVSFPPDPTPEDLAPFNVFIVFSIERPTLTDPRTQKIQRGSPIFQNGRWEEVWIIRQATQEEIVEYDITNAPEPEWETFKTGIIQSSSMNSAFLSALSSAPIAVSMLTAALTGITNTRGPQDFITAWNTLIQQNLVPPAVVLEVIELATESNIPQDFIDAIQ